VTGDITLSTLEALAAVRAQPMSAYKLGTTTSVHPIRAIKLLAMAAELGFVEECGRTRMGRPVYRWKRIDACPVCASSLPREAPAQTKVPA
jgi:hypothetical protein